MVLLLSITTQHFLSLKQMSNEQTLQGTDYNTHQAHKLYIVLISCFIISGQIYHKKTLTQ